jgi:hypothetical protein
LDEFQAGEGGYTKTPGLEQGHHGFYKDLGRIPGWGRGIWSSRSCEKFRAGNGKYPGKLMGCEQVYKRPTEEMHIPGQDEESMGDIPARSRERSLVF